MNVLQLISSKGYFGAENMLVQLAAELKKRNGIRVIAGVIENIGSPHTEVTDACALYGIETVNFKCRYKFDYNTLVELRQFIVENKINLIHTHGYKANIYTYLSTLWMAVFQVATCHNWIDSSLKMSLYSRIDRYLLRKADSVVAVSDEVKAKIEKAGVKRNKVKTINNGISFNKKDMIPAEVKAVRKTLAIPENAIVVGSVGRLSEEKGHRYLLEAFLEIIKENQDVYLLIVGDGDLKAELELSYNSPQIIFAGFRRDLDALYPCMDIFVLPSLVEGLPMALLEAMSWSLPVIATGVGQIPKVIEDKVTGIITPAGSSSDIKEALLTLIKNPSKSKEFGRNGHDKVKDLYSAEQMADQYIALYQDLRRLVNKNG